MRGRLTAHYVYYDGQHGYEALGHDAFSQRPFIEITKKLALYEDTGYTPKEVAELRDKLLGNTADDWMGMYHIAADRADKAEAEVERLQTNMIKYEICYDTTRESYDKAEAENAKLRAALSKVEDMCVSFHEGGPYQDNEEVRRIMEIYDIAHSALEGGGADG